MASEVPLISVVVPVSHDAGNIVHCLQGISTALKGHPHEILLCHDSEGDSSAAIGAMGESSPTLRLIRNTAGHGVAPLLQAGFRAARGDVVVSTTMASADRQGSIPAMAERIRAGADLVYGPRTTHGPRTLPRFVGLLLRRLGGVTTGEATDDFRAYSARFLRDQTIESTGASDVALELAAKAHLGNYRIDRVPSDQRRFEGLQRLAAKVRLPKRWYWYGQVVLPPLAVWGTLLAMVAAWIVMIQRYGADWPYWDELAYLSHTVGAQPLSWEVLWAQHNGHRILIPKIVYFGVMKMSNYQTTILMYMNVVFLAVGAGCVIVALRRAQGRKYVLDAVLLSAALAFSQYHNILWAFQIWATMSAALVLMVIAIAVNIRGSTDSRLVILMGTVTTLLPFCGGTGMGMAPGFFLWLFGIGLVYLLRGGDRQDRTFAARALASAVVAAAAWCLAVYGLPPSSALQTMRNGLRSWTAFVALMSEVYGTTVEFLSTPFIPESMYQGLPVLYDGSTWGHWGLFLLISVTVILLTAWIRRPGERVRISAISASVMAFVMLTVVLYLSRGFHGRAVGASDRYSTVAMPLLAIAVVTYALYAPKRLRVAVWVTTAAALVGLLYGPHGNLAKLRALGSLERDGYVEFERELSRPGGTTIEELAGHFGEALYAPGDAHQVADFIQLMAEHRVGPFRSVPIIPARVSAWSASPLPLTVTAAYGATWDGRRAVKSSNVHGVLSIRLPKPIQLSALRFTFRVNCRPPGANVTVAWYAPSKRQGDVAHVVRWECPVSDSGVQTSTASVFSTIHRLDIGLSTGFTEWELLSSERLEPAATTEGGGATRH